MVKKLNLVKPGDWVMNYIYDELLSYSSSSGVSPFGVYEEFYPFVPAASNIDRNLIQNTFNVPDENFLLGQYDVLYRLRNQPFYRIKKEQLMMYLDSGANIERVSNAVNVIMQTLDREDVAAQTVNSWGSRNVLRFDENELEPQEFNIFFHKIRTFLIDESRDLLELNSVNLASNKVKLIIEMDYHVNDVHKDNKTDYITYD
jgi:hypothetical protein